MKYFIGLFSLLLFLTVLSSCFKHDVEIQSEIQQYSATEDIINPPDSFLIMIPTTSNYTLKTEIVLESDAVWSIRKLYGTSNLVWFRKDDDASSYYISYSDTLGLQGSIDYDLYTSVSSQTSTIMKLRFDKTIEDYESFHNKF